MVIMYRIRSALYLYLFCAIRLSCSQLLIDTDEPYNEVDSDFLSVTIDVSAIETDFRGINLQSTSLINLAKALTPVTVRVGGTSGDFLTFIDSPKVTRNISHSDFIMTQEQFDMLNTFVDTVGWKFIFGLNQLRRNPNGQWDSSNAELLIDYCMKKGYKVAWELGNEPDCYKEDNFTVVSGALGAEGFKQLRKILGEKRYPVTLLAGPDVAVLSRLNYLSDFLANIDGATNATTWHHYYGNSASEKLTDFYNVRVLDTLIDQLYLLQVIINNASYEGDLWIGETSSTYGGGNTLLSSSFLSGFMWLDKLGLAAYTQKKVFRQDLIGAKYSLIESSGYPLPDYWLSLLYKRLVGTKVLTVHNAFEYGRQIRIYAHCAKPPYNRGSVVLLALNTLDLTVPVVLKNEQFINSQRDIYWLMPHPATNITSRVVALNGDPLSLGNNEDVPVLRPVVQDPEVFVLLPGLSFGYIVFKNAAVEACL